MNFAELLTERRSTGTGDIMATDADDSIKALEGSADHSEHDERLGLCAHGEFFLECNMGECGDDAMSPLRSTIEHAEDVCECDVCEERRLVAKNECEHGFFIVDCNECQPESSVKEDRCPHDILCEDCADCFEQFNICHAAISSHTVFKRKQGLNAGAIADETDDVEPPTKLTKQEDTRIAPRVEGARLLTDAEKKELFTGVNFVTHCSLSPEALALTKVPSREEREKNGCKCRGRCKECGCTRNPRYTPKGRLDQRRSKNPIVECGEHCGCSVDYCHNRLTQTSSGLKMELMTTRDRGIGAVAVENAERGAFVCEYAGVIVPASTGKRTGDYMIVLEGLGGHEQDFFIDAEASGNESRFFNHSCDPNLIALPVYTKDKDVRIPRIAFFARKRIVRGNELTFDYHRGMSLGGLKKTFGAQLKKCLCGSGDRCRTMF